MATYTVTVGNKTLVLDDKRRVRLYTVGGKPEAFIPGHSLTDQEAGQAFKQWEESKQAVDHAWASSIKSDPRFKSALKKAEENEDFETLDVWNNDPTALREGFQKYLDKARSPEELREMKAARKRADKLEKEIVEGRNQSLSDFAEVMTVKGKRAFKAPPRELTEDEEQQKFYDSMVADAQLDSDRHRLLMLEKKAEGKEGLSVEEAGQLMSLRNAVAAADAEGSGDE